MKELIKKAYLDANANAIKGNSKENTLLNFEEFWNENKGEFKNLLYTLL